MALEPQNNTAVAGAFLFSLVKQFSGGDALWSGTTE